MTVLEAIARPLPHGVSYDQVARATLAGGSKQEVEWMLAGLPAFQTALIRGRWQMDLLSRRYAAGVLLGELLAQGWAKKADAKRVERLVEIVEKHWFGWPMQEGAERVRPHQHICPSCDGNRGIMLDLVWRDCPRCKGTGRNEMRPHSLMRELDFVRGPIYPQWVKRHHDALAYLDAQESQAVEHMGKRLYGKRN